MRHRLIIASIVINSILVVLEVFIMLQSFFQWMPKEEDKILWYQAFTYYTEDSNITLFIGSLSMLISSVLLLKNKKDKAYYHILKYLGVVTTMVIFTTVYIFMIVYKEPSLGFSIHGNLWLLSHTICPILGLFSYLFLDSNKIISKKNMFLPIIFTICYTIMILLIYSFDGRLPYVSDFNNDYKISFWFILLLGLIEVTITVILSFVILLIKSKISNRLEKVNEYF